MAPNVLMKDSYEEINTIKSIIKVLLKNLNTKGTLSEEEIENIGETIIPTLWLEYRHQWYKDNPYKNQEKRYVTNIKTNKRMRSILRNNPEHREAIKDILPKDLKIIINPGEVVLILWNVKQRYQLYPKWEYPLGK